MMPLWKCKGCEGEPPKCWCYLPRIVQASKGRPAKEDARMTLKEAEKIMAPILEAQKIIAQARFHERLAANVPWKQEQEHGEITSTKEPS